MRTRSWKLGIIALGLAGGLCDVALPAPAPAPTEVALGDVLAGTAVPHAVKLKDLTPEWRRLNVTGDALLGMGGMMQSMMQGVGAMFGGGTASEAIYTRGALLKIADQQFLVGYRLAPQGLDFGAIMAMGAAAAGAAPGGPPKPPQPPPVTPDSELSLVLVNVRAIATITDIRPFNLQEVLRTASPGMPDTRRTPEPPKPAPAKPAAK